MDPDADYLILARPEDSPEPYPLFSIVEPGMAVLWVFSSERNARKFAMRTGKAARRPAKHSASEVLTIANRGPIDYVAIDAPSVDADWPLHLAVNLLTD